LIFSQIQRTAERSFLGQAENAGHTYKKDMLCLVKLEWKNGTPYTFVGGSTLPINEEYLAC
jgi:hypothetical protein